MLTGHRTLTFKQTETINLASARRLSAGVLREGYFLEQLVFKCHV